jgi:hypothetical protein
MALITLFVIQSIEADDHLPSVEKISESLISAGVDTDTLFKGTLQNNDDTVNDRIEAQSGLRHRKQNKKEETVSSPSKVEDDVSTIITEPVADAVSLDSVIALVGYWNKIVSRFEDERGAENQAEHETLNVVLRRWMKIKDIHEKARKELAASCQRQKSSWLACVASRVLQPLRIERKVNIDSSVKTERAVSSFMDKLIDNQNRKLTLNFIGLTEVMRGSTVIKKIMTGESSQESTEVRRDASFQCLQLENMRARAEERRYQKMIGKNGTAKLTVAKELKEMNEGMSFALHFIIVFIASFAVGYYLYEIFGDAGMDKTPMVMISEEVFSSFQKFASGGICCFISLVIECIVYILYEERKQRIDHRSREKTFFSNQANSTNVRQLHLFV